MYVRVTRADLSFGTANDLIATIEADLQPIYTSADGFIGYLLVPLDEATVLSVRAFEDSETLGTATAAAVPAMTEIAEAFGLKLSEVGEAEAFGAIVAYKEPWSSSTQGATSVAEPESLEPMAQA